MAFDNLIKKNEFVETLNLDLMDNLRRTLQYQIESLDGLLILLKTSEKHSPVVVVNEDFNGITVGSEPGHWVLDDFVRVDIALGLEAQLSKINVHRSHPVCVCIFVKGHHLGYGNSDGSDTMERDLLGEEHVAEGTGDETKLVEGKRLSKVWSTQLQKEVGNQWNQL